ncbi:LysR family transcriptional regulator [Noviherbaspirillum saxi]|uniref:LysR family transcriptional regulator n=1 Tax=Noviherbaspirillum saxi TaxID=2320863 RepID=A0A3A3FJT4_9BURK|nr:LysR family transcriptional regulator [Noviherbaspirillum saxi]RJF95763.1 LysR family transcriptional regulator [Noviherbaspirillum saxi]
MQSILDSKWLVFMKVAELGSLTKAATVFDVPQSMISRNVSVLERQCGARLFRRTGRGVVLTEFGEQLYPRLQALMQQADRLADDIRSSGGVAAGEVRVGMLPSSVPMLASKLYSLVKEKFPRVRLHLSDGPSTQLEEWLREGRMDMALLLREGPVSDSGESVLAQISLRLIGPRNDPLLQEPTVDLSALQGRPLVVPSHPHPLRARLDTLAEARGINLNIAAEADSIRLQHEIVAAGGGYAITSGLFEMDSDSRLASARIVKPELLRSVVLSTSPRRPHTLATREVLRLIVQVVPELLQTRH